MRSRLLNPLVFIAGASTMSTEMCASRLLAPFFGASILVWANIIGLILIYLAVGYFVGGRVADRHPSMTVMARLMLIAAAAIAVLPFIAQPFLSAAVSAFASTSVGAFLGSFFTVMLLFSIPVTLLGMAAPFAVRLGVRASSRPARSRAACTRSRRWAASSARSSRSRCSSPRSARAARCSGSACLLALAAAPALGRRYMLAPVAIAMIALLPPGLIKPGSDIIYEGESAYQFIQVQKLPGNEHVLHLNEGWADHSIWRPHQVLTGGYWDQFLLAPSLHGGRFRNLAMIGYAGGTVGRAYGVYWPKVAIEGIELDPQVTAVGKRYFGLASNPRVSVATADGRVYLETHSRRYDAIFLDAFQQPYIPFYLTTQEFWTLTVERLKARGMVMANVGRVPGDDRLAND